MSAIAGLVMLDDNTTDIEVIKNMAASLQHCGPDTQRHLQVGNIAFAHALLATTPEALIEAQPWTDANSACVVVCDSRLDNRNLLATALGLVDRAIDNIGDAELIFAAYQKWGDACPEKLLGDFAFAIWNPATQYLFCARDPLGVRPFYYHYIEDKIFAFATTSEALRLVLAKPPALNEGRLADALTNELEGHDRTSTFFRDVKRLPPAHSLSLRPSSPLQMSCYWQPLQNPPSPFPASEAQWIEQLEALFVEAVHCRLRSHISIGAMLSGGLDSSAVVAVACEKLGQDDAPVLSTFSAISSEPDCAETRAIGLMQSNFTIKTNEIDPEKSPELLQAVADQWSQLGEPFDAHATLVHAQYLRAKQSNIRVLLDGIDADGLLTEAGYLHDLARNGQWRRVWHESRASVRFWGPDASLSHFLRPLISEFLIPMPVRRFVRYLRQKLRPENNHQQDLISPEFARQIDLLARYKDMATNTAGIRTTDGDGHTAHSVMSASHCANGLERYHRLASLHGIEPRHPFMDRRLVEFCAWLPLELRLRDGYPKWAMRKAISQRLPDGLAWRRGKEHLGWQFNQALWHQAGQRLISGPLQPWLQKSALDTVQTQYAELNKLQTLQAVNENQLEVLLKLAAVNSWLNRLG